MSKNSFNIHNLSIVDEGPSKNLDLQIYQTIKLGLKYLKNVVRNNLIALRV